MERERERERERDRERERERIIDGVLQNRATRFAAVCICTGHLEGHSQNQTLERLKGPEGEIPIYNSDGFRIIAKCS